MKLTFFFLTLSACLAAYNARHLPQTNQPNAIKMVTGEEHFTPPPQPLPPPSIDLINILETYFRSVFKQLAGDGIGKPSIFQDQATYGRHNPRAAPPPKPDPRHDQTAYGRQNPKTPPSPKLDPSQGHTTYGRDKPKAPPAPTIDPPHHQTAYGRENLKAPFSPEIGGENPKAPPSRGGCRQGQDKAEAPPPPPPSYGLEKDRRRRTIYGRDDPSVPTPPESNTPAGQTTYNGQEDSRTPPIMAPNDASYGRDDPTAPTPPKPAYGRENPKAPFSPQIGGENPKTTPSRGGGRQGQDKAEAPPPPPPSYGLEKDRRRRTIYCRDDPSVPTPPDSNTPAGQTTYNGQEDWRTPPIMAPNDASYGRDDPRAPTPPKPADPTRPVLKESPCIGRRNACKSAVDHPPPPQSFTSFIEIQSDEEWQTVNTGLFQL